MTDKSKEQQLKKIDALLNIHNTPIFRGEFVKSKSEEE
jgi:hypothetical protein